MDYTILISVAASFLLVRMVFVYRREAKRELARFRGQETGFLSGVSEQFNAAAASLADAGGKKNTVGWHAKHSKDDARKKLADAGLETSEAQGKYLLFRLVSMVLGPVVGLSAYTFMPAYYATLSTIFCTGMGIALPFLWLKARVSSRTEDIQRELPLVLDLTNLGTSAGWDVSSALERVIDALYIEFPEHPLIKELKKARWLIPSGYTWEEALLRVSNKLGDETVRRTTMALSQAIRQGGDRSKQLEGIAQDAQRIYYTSLDKRLATMPVKALLVTMLLLLAYFIILLAPAIVQVKNVLK